jgi:hypothetical protein
MIMPDLPVVQWTPDFVENCTHYSRDEDAASGWSPDFFDAVVGWCSNVSNETIEQILTDDPELSIYGFSNVGECVVRIVVPFRAWFESLDDEDQAAVRG